MPGPVPGIRDGALLEQLRDSRADGMSRQLRGCSPAEIQTILNEAAILYHDCERKLSKKQETEWKPWFAQREFRSGPIPEGVRTVQLKEDLNVMILDDSGSARL